MNTLSAKLLKSCDGWGYIICLCGGDSCFCGLDGITCPGCADCDHWIIEDLDEQDLEDWNELSQAV